MLTGTRGEGETNDMNKFEPLKLNLQYFADNLAPEDETEDETKDKVEDTDKALTPEEIAKQIESESDRKLASARAKWETEQQDRQAKAIKEALEENERLSSLSDKERKDAELTKREQELETRIAEYQKKSMLSETEVDLRAKELPVTFATILLGENGEDTLENINNFKTEFDSAVNEAVKVKLRQETPTTSGAQSKGKAFDLAEMAKESRLI